MAQFVLGLSSQASQVKQNFITLLHRMMEITMNLLSLINNEFWAYQDYVCVNSGSYVSSDCFVEWWSVCAALKPCILLRKLIVV